MEFKYYFLFTNDKIKRCLVSINKDTHEHFIILKLNTSKIIKP